MAHEILSVKLYELDKKISKVHSRIQLSETASHDQIKTEIEKLQDECEENTITLQNKLSFSKGKVVGTLSQAYEEVEKIIQQVKCEVGNSQVDTGSEEITAEEKILLAEYALDFAMQAANHALLIAMEALDAQMTLQEKGE